MVEVLGAATRWRRLALQRVSRLQVATTSCALPTPATPALPLPLSPSSPLLATSYSRRCFPPSLHSPSPSSCHLCPVGPTPRPWPPCLYLEDRVWPTGLPWDGSSSGFGVVVEVCAWWGTQRGEFHFADRRSLSCLTDHVVSSCQRRSCARSRVARTAPVCRCTMGLLVSVSRRPDPSFTDFNPRALARLVVRPRRHTLPVVRLLAPSWYERWDERCSRGGWFWLHEPLRPWTLLGQGHRYSSAPA